MFGIHEDQSSQTGTDPAMQWVTPDGCYINQWHPNRRKFALAVAIGGNVDPGGDNGIASVSYVVVQPDTSSSVYTVTEPTLVQPGWFLGPHGSPVQGGAEPAKLWGWAVEIDLTSHQEGTLQVAAIVTMKSGESGSAVPTYLSVYNNSVGTLNIRPNMRQVWLDEVNGNDSNAGYTSAAPVQTLTAAINKTRDSSGDCSSTVIQVMSDMSSLNAAPSTWSTSGTWPLTLRSYNGRHKLTGTGTWTGVGSGGARVVFEGFDFVDGGIAVNSSSDYARTLVAVGCHSYPSWWTGTPSARSLAEAWQPLSGDGSNLDTQYFHCEHYGTLDGPVVDKVWDCKISGTLGEAVKTRAADWMLGVMDITGPGDSPDGKVVVTDTLVSRLVTTGIIEITYQAYDPATDIDFAEPLEALVGLTDVGVKLTGFTVSSGSWAVQSVGRKDNGAPYVRLVAAVGNPGGESGTKMETATVSDGQTWTTLATRTAIQLGAAATNCVLQTAVVNPGFAVGFDQNGQAMSRVALWNLGIDTANMTLDAAATSCLLANLSIRGNVTMPGAVSWADSSIVDSVFSQISGGTWPAAAFAMANHFETGTSYGQDATTGPYFASQGLNGLQGTRGTAMGFMPVYERWRAKVGGEASVSPWVLD